MPAGPPAPDAWAEGLPEEQRYEWLTDCYRWAPAPAARGLPHLRCQGGAGARVRPLPSARLGQPAEPACRPACLTAYLTAYLCWVAKLTDTGP